MAAKKTVAVEQELVQTEYAQTTFKATQERNKKTLNLEKLTPPSGGGWRLVNFHPVPSVEPLTTFFVCVWERD